MTVLGAETVAKVFESRPVDTATWFITLDAISAIHRIVKDKRVVEVPTELAAQRVVKSLGNGDFHSIDKYFTSPEVYPPGMDVYARKIGARSVRGYFDPALKAVLKYKTDRDVKPTIDHLSPTFDLCHGAENFPSYFATKTADMASQDAYISLVDITLAIKNETAFWIDKDTAI